LIKNDVDLAIVVGGYNSSNTSHIVELLQQKHPTYFILDESKIISKNSIKHFLLDKQKETVTNNYLPSVEKIKIAITSGASCPDATVDKVIQRIINVLQ
jgi:4-hydroxy-3-methylbut-2-enyl diphosphate reductase